jgi:hypothetical protein
MVLTWALLAVVGVVGLRYLRGGVAGRTVAATSRRRLGLRTAEGG